ncbi:N-6 DNA methylase [Streptomonospora nanhaiensis]|uniref:site-specific DNA-methyltransferase (adenine-specific) n=1 Tax=Streptomonospora nanhaiensis TaxID=1323731 RepID=A0ABY6YTQ8_9ACTN|nr:N-6 DNA methylase [Streptomonospora nanhaiensis]WAE75508.1 N-6 DNA methylase [Streptomonospora nanhaiensis]
MSGTNVEAADAEELLRIAERLAGKGQVAPTRAIAAMLVLGSEANQENFDDLWDVEAPRSRLASAIEPSSLRGAGSLQAAWEDWLRVGGRADLFADETPFREFPVGRLKEAAKAVHDLVDRRSRDDGTHIGHVFDRFLSLVGERRGKSSGEFTTPRSVNELIIRLAELRLGMVVGDFYAGVGGTLVAALAQVGVPAWGETPISGAELNREIVFLARINLLLHGADPGLIRNEDTLTSWRPTDDQGRSFDRILSNPPFSLYYDEDEYRAPRDLLGRTPSSKSELMMLQQMRASIRPGGRVIMAMAHGPLFREGQEKSIRRLLLERGDIEAVVGIGPNLFHGTAIPACLLVLRCTGTTQPTPPGVLFINAEREVLTGRNQNRLEPRHIEKIARVFHQRAELPGFSAVISFEDLARNSYNLNIRRYVEPLAEDAPVLDLGAMVNGGVPPYEVEITRKRFAAFGLAPDDLFHRRADGYLAPSNQGGFADVVERLPDLCAPAEELVTSEHDRSWPEIVRKAHPPTARPTFDAFRQSLVDGFCARLTESGVLDEYELAGVFAQWWAEYAQEIQARFHDDRQELLDCLGRRLAVPLRDQIKELVRLRQRSLEDTVRNWGERYGQPLSHLLEQSETADRRFAARLRELGLDLGGNPDERIIDTRTDVSNA